MNAAQVHLALTHFPVIGTCIAVGILAFGYILKNSSYKKLSYILFIVMAAVTVPVFSSGEEAEEVVEELSGVSEGAIEDHEHLAEKAIWLMGFLGAVSLAGVYANAKGLSFSNILGTVILVVSLITCGVFIRVGHLGGLIRHTEIGTSANGGGERHHDDDDDHHEEHDDDED